MFNEQAVNEEDRKSISVAAGTTPTHWGRRASCGQGRACPRSGTPQLGQATRVPPCHRGHEKGVGNATPSVSRKPPCARERGGLSGAWRWGEGRWQHSQPSCIFPSRRTTPISSRRQEAGAFHRDKTDGQTDRQTLRHMPSSTQPLELRVLLAGHVSSSFYTTYHGRSAAGQDQGTRLLWFPKRKDKRKEELGGSSPTTARPSTLRLGFCP